MANTNGYFFPVYNRFLALFMALGLSFIPTSASALLSSRIKIGVQHLNSEFASATAQSYLNTGFNFAYDMGEFSSVEIQPIASFKSGYVQSDLFDSSDSTGKFIIEHASVNLHNETKVWSGSLGILQLNRRASDLISTSVGAAGVLVGYESPEQEGDSSQRWKLTAQWQVPNSFQENASLEEEVKIPLISLVAFSSHFENRDSEYQIRAGLLNTQNLSEGIAEEANLKGNTTRPSPINSRIELTHSIQTLELRGETKNWINKAFALHFDGTLLYNPLAPSKLNFGYSIEPKVQFGPDRRHWLFSYEYFYLEPDVALSAINSVRYETNRRGQSLKAAFKTNLMHHLVFRLTERNAIFMNPFQPHEFLGSIEWESFYEIL